MIKPSFFAYNPGCSYFHKLDPRVKIIGLMVLSLILFSINSLILQAFIFVAVLAVIYFSGIPLRKLFRSISPMFFFIAVVFLLQFLFVPEPQNFVSGPDVEVIQTQVVYNPETDTWEVIEYRWEDAENFPEILSEDQFHEKRPMRHISDGRTNPMEKHIFSWGPVNPTLWSLYLAFTVSLKFVILLILAALITMTTPKSLMIQAIDRMVSPIPLKYVGLTSHDVALMAFLTIRFIPHILLTAYVTTCAAQSRGLAITRSPVRYVRLLSGTLVNSIIRESGQIARSMENRGYGRKRKTFYYEMTLRKRDFVCLAGTAFIFIAFIINKIP